MTANIGMHAFIIMQSYLLIHETSYSIENIHISERVTIQCIMYIYITIFHKMINKQPHLHLHTCTHAQAQTYVQKHKQA